MQKEFYQIVTLIVVLGTGISGLKLINDYFFPTVPPDFKALKKQHYIGNKKDDNLTKVNFQKVTNLTKEQIENAEMAILNIPAQGTTQSNPKNITTTSGEAKEVKVIDIPNEQVAKRMMDALKQDGQKALLLFEKKSEEEKEKDKTNTIQTSCAVDNNSTNKQAVKEENGDFRTAIYSKKNAGNKDDFSIEELSLKIPLKGGAFSGSYDKKYSSNSDFDIPIQYENHYIVQGVFEGGNGGRISGELIKIDPNTGAPFKDSNKTTIYGKICSSGSGYLITTANGNPAQTFPLSFSSF